MKSKLKKLVRCLAVLFALTSLHPAQLSPKSKEITEANKSQPAKRTFQHNETIEEKYDKFKDVTTVSLKMQITGELRNGLILSIVDAFQGSRAIMSKSSSGKPLLMFMGAGDKQKYQLFHSLIILADEERIKFADAAYFNTPVQSSYVEAMAFSITRDTLGKIVAAKKAEAQLGNTEFIFTENQLEALRDFYSRLVP